MLKNMLIVFLCFVHIAVFAENAKSVFAIQVGRDPITQIDDANKIEISQNHHHEISWKITVENHSWQITLKSPSNEGFKIGTYQRAFRQNETDTTAGLYLIDGNMVQSFSNAFLVFKSIEYDKNYQIKSLAVDFVAKPRGNDFELYRGALRFNSKEPINLDEYQKPFAKSLTEMAIAHGALLAPSTYENPELFFSANKISIGYNSYSFAAPKPQALKAGKYYFNASNSWDNLSQGTQPWFNNCGDYVSINSEITADFVVRELKLNQYHEVESFAVDFNYEQPSYFDFPDRIYSAIRFNSKFPIEIASITTFNEASGLIIVPYFSKNGDSDPSKYQQITLQKSPENQSIFTITDIQNATPPTEKFMLAPSGYEEGKGFCEIDIPKLRITKQNGEVSDFATSLKSIDQKPFVVGTQFKFTSLVPLH